MKQPAVFFILFGAFYLLSSDLRRKRGWKRIVLGKSDLDLGAIGSLRTACLFLWRAGVFDKFWFWTINYARQYGSLIPLGAAPKIFGDAITEVIDSCWLLWMLAGLARLAGLDERTQVIQSSFSVCCFLLFWRFCFHLPALSLFAGVAVSACATWPTGGPA